MSNQVTTCYSCKRECLSYDADRGYSCGRTDCPSYIEAEAKQEQYNESCRVHRELAPKLVGLPARLFTVEEIGWLTEHHGTHGFELQNTAARHEIIEAIGKKWN